MRRIISILILIAVILTGCGSDEKTEYAKFSHSFFDAFDSMTQIVGYAKNEEEFDGYVEILYERMLALHKLYNIYYDYEGVHNIKTINDNAGIKPVKVEKEIIDLLLFCKEWYEKTGGRTNIAMGAVLRIWHDYRDEGISNPENAKLPPMDLLREAAKHTDLDQVIVDVENSTVFLEDEKMSLDVGAVAKGFATEIATKELINAGLTSALISPGGNIRALDQPLDGVREKWGVGIQNPDKFIALEEGNLLDTIFINNGAAVSSGDYQRYYVVDGKAYHHLIDPDTLMPGEYYRSITVVAEDAGVADFISTTAFLLPYKESRALIDSLDKVEAIWIMPDGEVLATEGMDQIRKSKGASGLKLQ